MKNLISLIALMMLLTIAVKTSFFIGSLLSQIEPTELIASTDAKAEYDKFSKETVLLHENFLNLYGNYDVDLSLLESVAINSNLPTANIIINTPPPRYSSLQK